MACSCLPPPLAGRSQSVTMKSSWQRSARLSLMPLSEASPATLRHRSTTARTTAVVGVPADVRSGLGGRARSGRRLLAGLSLGLLAAGVLGCQSAVAPPQTAPPTASAEARRQQQQQRQRQQLAARQCLQQREVLLEGLAELRRAEASLAEQRVLAPAPTEQPPVWDEEKESRYSEVDQELDRQRYEQDLAAWRQRQAASSLQRQRLDAAQQRLNRQAQLLQQRYPGLFTGPASIEVRPQELARLSRCPEPPA